MWSLGCQAGGILTETLVDKRTEGADSQSMKSQHEAMILVPNDKVQTSMKLGAVLDTGSSVTCLSERVASRL